MILNHGAMMSRRDRGILLLKPRLRLPTAIFSFSPAAAYKLGFLPDNVSGILTRISVNRIRFCLHNFFGGKQISFLCMLFFPHFHATSDWFSKIILLETCALAKDSGDVEYVFIWFQFSVNWPWSPGLSRNMALDPMLFGDKTWNSFQQYKFFNLILWQKGVLE